jgi:hypothetical protein
MTWTTLVEPKYTKPYGVDELHNVWFLPKNWPGKGTVISLLIPECELHFCFMHAGTDEPIVYVNRPTKNKNVKGWLRTVCEIGIEHKAAVSFGCDTAEQAGTAARRAAKLLRGYERAALERMYEASSRSRSNLS